MTTTETASTEIALRASDTTHTLLIAVASALLFLSFATFLYAAPPERGSSSATSPQSKQSATLNEKGTALAHQGKLKEAEEVFREAVSLDSKNLSAIFNLGSVLIQHDKLEEAIHLLERHAKNAGNDAGLFTRLGDAYFSKKNLPSARKNYEKALSLNPNIPKVPARLGTVYSLSEDLPHNLDLAIKQYLHAVEQEPSNKEYLSNLVNLYLATKESHKAVSTAKRALQVAPSAEIYASLGAAYELQKEWKNSLIAYRRAKDLGDTRDELKEKIEILERISKES
jgi:tetratricopeptide (TPR) repeat protein